MITHIAQMWQSLKVAVVNKGGTLFCFCADVLEEQGICPMPDIL